MPENVFPIDQSRSMFEQEMPGHNRWHPDIPPATTVRLGSDFRMDCREWTDGQVENTDDADDIHDMDLSKNHVLSGPVAIDGAEPGDILDMGPHLPNSAPDGLADAGWGYTGIFARENGGGFLTDIFPEAQKAIWDFHGIYATSRHVPRVRFAGRTSGIVRVRPLPRAARRVEPPRAGPHRHGPGPGAAAGAPPGAG